MKIPELSRLLRDSADVLASSPVVTGFDGFVDELISVVDQRQSLEAFEPVKTIADFGDKISAAAGHSSLREIVVKQVDPGGCAVNMGDGLAALGVPVTTFATVGEPMHAAFAEYASKTTLVSWGREPGRTLAYEFHDGKLMFSAVSQLQEFNPTSLKGYLADGAFQEACEQASLIAITDWTLFPHMTRCWEFLLEEVFRKCPVKPRYFFDLVDPSSRSEADIVGMLQVLSRFAEVGEVTLGLNQNEANILSRIQKLDTVTALTPEEAVQQAAALRDDLGIHEVVIHSIKYAVGATANGSAQVFGPYCEQPVKSTGAGDRFNAGFALGKILKVNLEACLILAVAASGYFVRKGESASLGTLASFLESHL